MKVFSLKQFEDLYRKSRSEDDLNAFVDRHFGGMISDIVVEVGDLKPRHYVRLEVSVDESPYEIIFYFKSIPDGRPRGGWRNFKSAVSYLREIRMSEKKKGRVSMDKDFVASELVKVARDLTAQKKWELHLGYNQLDNDGDLVDEQTEFVEKYDSLEKLLADRAAWADIKNRSRVWEKVGDVEFEEAGYEWPEQGWFWIWAGRGYRLSQEEKVMIKEALKKHGFKVV
jgi:hypothetical protein